MAMARYLARLFHCRMLGRPLLANLPQGCFVYITPFRNTIDLVRQLQYILGYTLVRAEIAIRYCSSSFIGVLRRKLVLLVRQLPGVCPACSAIPAFADEPLHTPLQQCHTLL